jgi:hypothetical protein
VAKVGTSKTGGTISQPAVVHPWLATDAQQTNKQQQQVRSDVYVKSFKADNLSITSYCFPSASLSQFTV